MTPMVVGPKAVGDCLMRPSVQLEMEPEAAHTEETIQRFEPELVAAAAVGN